MITITEKDGATIIVIEEPTASEQKLIKKVKEVQRFSDGSVWGKFKCNQKAQKKEQPAEVSKQTDAVPKELVGLSLDDFEPILDESDIPF